MCQSQARNYPGYGGKRTSMLVSGYGLPAVAGASGVDAGLETCQFGHNLSIPLKERANDEHCK